MTRDIRIAPYAMKIICPGNFWQEFKIKCNNKYSTDMLQLVQLLLQVDPKIRPSSASLMRELCQIQSINNNNILTKSQNPFTTETYDHNKAAQHFNWFVPDNRTNQGSQTEESRQQQLHNNFEVNENLTVDKLISIYQDKSYSQLPSFSGEFPLPINSCYSNLTVLKESTHRQLSSDKLRQATAQTAFTNCRMNDYYPKRHFEDTYFLHDTQNINTRLTDILTDYNKILIIGEAGIGKTTWCKRAAFLWSSSIIVNIEDSNNAHQHNPRTFSSSSLSDQFSCDVADQEFLQKGFKFCFALRLRDITDDLNTEMSKMCNYRFSDSKYSAIDFIIAHANEILFLLGN